MTLPPHVKAVRKPSGRVYLYLMLHRGTERARRPIRLPDDPASPEFWAAYARALRESGSTLPPPPPQSATTLRCLLAAWKKSPEWHALSPGTRANWESFTRVLAAAWGEAEVRDITPADVVALRDARAATPAATNNLLRCLSSAVSWGVLRGWRNDNPCLRVPKLRGGDPYAPWPWDAICDTRDALVRDGYGYVWHALALALYTGQRIGDVLAMRWDQLQGARIVGVVQEKTDKRLTLPMHRDLTAVLADIPRVAPTILANSRGRPWTGGGFQSTWALVRPKALVERRLVVHGLRKSAVVFMLEAGATVPETAAVTGQSFEMVEHYAVAVNQEKLAAKAVLKWERLETLIGNRA